MSRLPLPSLTQHVQRSHHIGFYGLDGVKHVFHRRSGWCQMVNLINCKGSVTEPLTQSRYWRVHHVVILCYWSVHPVVIPCYWSVHTCTMWQSVPSNSPSIIIGVTMSWIRSSKFSCPILTDIKWACGVVEVSVWVVVWSGGDEW